jgi:undecaprenyl-diphosphatase
VLSGLFELKSVIGGSEHTDAGAGALIIATALAFVVGYWSIAFLLRWVSNHSMIVFVVYRVALGLLVLVLTASGAIH